MELARREVELTVDRIGAKDQKASTNRLIDQIPIFVLFTISVRTHERRQVSPVRQ